MRLHFVETDPAVTEPGERVFDLLIEGTLVLDDYDLLEVTAANVAIVEEFDVSVQDGWLDLALRVERRAPTLSAIEILRVEP